MAERIVGETTKKYRFKNQSNTTFNYFLEHAIEHGLLSEGQVKAFKKKIDLYAKSQQVADGVMTDIEGNAIKNAGALVTDDLLNLPAYEFFADHAEELSDFIFDTFDNIEKSEAAMKKGGPTSGAGPVFKALSTLADAYNQNLPAQQNNYLINRKPLDVAAKTHTASTAPKRLIGGLPTRMVKGVSGLEIFDAVMERADDEAQKYLQIINRINSLDSLSSNDLKVLGAAETALNKIDAGKDLILYLFSTGGRVSEPLSLLAFDYSKPASSGENLKRSIFAVMEEYENKGSRFEAPSGKIIGKSYRIYYPPKVTKMRTGLSYEVGPTIGAILEKRAAIAKAAGSRQLFGFPVVSYSMPEGSTSVSSIDEATKTISSARAFEYGFDPKKQQMTYKNVSQLPSYLLGTNGILSQIPEKDQFGNLVYDERGQVKFLPLVFNEQLQQAEDFFTMHNLRQSFSSYARKYALRMQGKEGRPVNYGAFPAVFQGRMKDVISNSSDAAHYFMFGLLDEADHLAEFNEDFTKHLLSLMNSERTSDHVSRAGTFKLDTTPSTWTDIKGGTGELKTPVFGDVKKGKEEKIVTKKVDMFDGKLPDSIEALRRNNEIGKVRQYLKVRKALDNDPENVDLKFKKETLEAEGTEILKKSNQPSGKGVGTKAKVTAAGVAAATALGAGKAISATLPVVGAGTGIYFAGDALAKDTEEFKLTEDESNLKAKARQLGRAGAEVFSGFSPVPLDRSLLNLLPFSPNTSNGLNIILTINYEYI